MGRRPKIRPDFHFPQSGNIRPTQVPSEAHKLSFSFEYLDGQHGKFTYTDEKKKYFLKLLERLQNVCCMTRKDFIVCRGKPLRAHQIDWQDAGVSEDSFGMSEDVGSDAWQFSISSNQHGRVHGFFIENVFYIRWLDPAHNLYPGNE